MDDFQGIVETNEAVGPGYYLARVGLATVLGPVHPGQFAMIKLPSADFFLRRPFSIYSCTTRSLSILYRVAGKGTDFLSRLREGEHLAVLAPLGKGFTRIEGHTPVLLAGGIGIAGINLLRESLPQEAPCFYGCASEKELCLAGSPGDATLSCSTLDGSSGFHGTVVQLLEARLPTLKRPFQVFACGPEPMYRSLKSLLEPESIPCQILLEERMACGLGLCFGCVTRTLDEIEPYKRVCMEGPVFDLWQTSL